MGYAKLNFATSVTTAQAMYDVVRILNGTITSTASLSYASTVNSEIVNTLGENWTVLYGSVADTTTAYVVTSPCLSSAKTHYVKLHMFNGSASGWDLSTAFSTAGAGIGCNSISGATSATAVSNPAFYSTSSGATGGGRFIVRVDASNANIYIHWSQHHIAFYGICGSGTGFHGSYEYPETGLTQFSNYPPVLQYQYQYAAGSTFRTATVPAAGTGNGITFQAIQFYLPTTASLEGVYNLGVSGFGTVIPSDFNPVTTLAADGSSVYPLVPFYWSLPSLGVPFVNISQLCGVYRMARSATTAEDLFTIGADSYVWLPIGTATSGGTQESAIALLKA